MEIVSKKKKAKRAIMRILARYGGRIDNTLIELARKHGNNRMADELVQFRLILILVSTQRIPRLRQSSCVLHLISTDLIRQVRTALLPRLH